MFWPDKRNDGLTNQQSHAIRNFLAKLKAHFDWDDGDLRLCWGRFSVVKTTVNPELASICVDTKECVSVLIIDIKLYCVLGLRIAVYSSLSLAAALVILGEMQI